MAYKQSKGEREFGDIEFEDDADTKIDFEQDYISMQTGGNNVLVVSGSQVGVGTASPDYTLDVAGDIGVDENIYHNGDADTLIQFATDKIVLKAGNRAMITTEIKPSQPHEVTINDGSNNVDFVVKGNGSRGGNPGMRFDASTNKVGINGVGTPEESLHVDGNIKLFGEDVRLKIDGDTDSHPGVELYEAGTRKWIVFNDYTNDNLTFKTNSTTRMSIEQDGNVGIGTTSPSTTLSVAGSVSANVTNINNGSNNASTYNVGSSEYAIFCNTRPTAQGGIDSALTINLPSAASYPGRILIIKDAGGYSGTNAITLQRSGGDTINGNATSLTIPNSAGGATKQMMSDGVSQWYEIGN